MWYLEADIPMTDFVTIATFDNYISANLAKQKLEAHDIACYLADEYTVVMQWTLSNAVGGIKLRVLKEDEHKAIAVLNEIPEPVPADYLVEGDGNLVCPNCGSNNTVEDNYNQTATGISWLILGFPLPIGTRRSGRCFYCGHNWSIGSSEA
jgi:hypothetical protein